MLWSRSPSALCVHVINTQDYRISVLQTSHTAHIRSIYNIPTWSHDVSTGMSVSIVSKYVGSNAIRQILDHKSEASWTVSQ